MTFAVQESWRYGKVQVNVPVLSEEQWNLSETTGGEQNATTHGKDMVVHSTHEKIVQILSASWNTPK